MQRFESEHIKPERFVSALLTSPGQLSTLEARRLMDGLYWIAVDMQNCPHLGGLTFFDLFTYDELFACWQVVNARMYICNGNAPLNRGLMPRQAIPLLRNIIQSADHALSSGRPRADLRFGHDTHLIRLLALMGVEGCDGREADPAKFHLAWQDYRVSPMAANLQLIFFRRAADGDVLVKLLHNEREVRLPLPATTGPYYRWTDLRSYLMEKCK